MKNRVLLLALRLAAIRQEFSPEEIQKALSLLQEYGFDSSLLGYARVDSEREKPRGSRRKTKSIEEQRSKAVIDLQPNDPEKYEVLSEFDSLVRKGRVLRTVEDIRRLGESLSKDFRPKNSRRESISKLMSLLAERPLEELRELLRVALSTSKVDEGDGDYQRLAQFIISGKIAPREKVPAVHRFSI